MIKGINVISAQNIISVSNDGKLCDWGEDINHPIKEIELIEGERNAVSVHSMTFPQDETNYFYIGSENSNIYKGRIHTKSHDAGPASHIESTYVGHEASVMSIDVHPKL